MTAAEKPTPPDDSLVWEPQTTGGPVALGADLVPVQRVEAQVARLGPVAYARALTTAEHSYCWQSTHLRTVAGRIAGRLAAKEALAKLLGCGLNGAGYTSGIRWQQVEVVATPTAPPRLRLWDRAAELAKQQNWEGFQLSLAHDGGMALATILAWRNPQTRSIM